MPNEDKRQKELTQEELDAQKFRTFFSTSVAQVPEAMSRREDAAEKAPRKGLFGGLFRRREDPAEMPAEPETEKPDALLGPAFCLLLLHYMRFPAKSW